MPTLSITKNWNDGDALTESMLDDIKTSVETFLNTTKIDADNIQDGGLSTGKYASSSVDAAALGTNAVTTVKITDLNVTTAKIADLAVTTAKIAAANVTAAKMESSINLPGAGVQVESKRVITANTNAAANLSIIRGLIAANGTIMSGEGFTASNIGTGQYSVTFTTAFADVPAITIGPRSPWVFNITSGQATTGFAINFFDAASAFASSNTIFNFIAIGQRA